jgi:hypothetical protein
MGLFDFFKKKPALPSLQHPFFGRLTYEDEDGWVGDDFDFKPLGYKVGVTIYAGPEGPDNRHIHYVENFASHWPQLLAAIEPIAKENIGPWIKDLDKKGIWNCLKLEGFDIFDSYPTDREWLLCFWCEEAGHWLMVSMRGLDPLGACVDG